ncbi:hypothetical protein [Rhodococcus rhodochrous]|uniref:hypothetical protein n=1 Tax=Rhodococcus rhodochrous TaxID=1829 RepID=UPI0021BDD03E|nr:hypothetical protein [Rhodococcus rhodochrous]MCQ4136855.1 hypothetical protein [Rhodococcus rhodochrous]MDJ0020817.1 hypothetical protein [Rhodococcus rhodochrous]
MDDGEHGFSVSEVRAQFLCHRSCDLVGPGVDGSHGVVEGLELFSVHAQAARNIVLSGGVEAHDEFGEPDRLFG